MMVRIGKARSAEMAWRAQWQDAANDPAPAPRAAAVPLKARTGFWLGICVLLALAFALLH